MSGQKRKLAETDLEIPDSEGEDDEDYGWAEDDEDDVPAMPPQWQGSEDILVPGAQEVESEEDEQREREWEVEKDALDGEGDVDGDGESMGDANTEQFRVIEDSEDELA